MKAEKIVKRTDGTQYQILVDVYLDTRKDKAIYNTTVRTKAPRKRKWVDIDMDISDYEYRCMSLEDRRLYNEKNMLRFVTVEEIEDVKNELWKKLKP